MIERVNSLGEIILFTPNAIKSGRYHLNYLPSGKSLHCRVPIPYGPEGPDIDSAILSLVYSLQHELFLQDAVAGAGFDPCWEDRILYAAVFPVQSWRPL